MSGNGTLRNKAALRMRVAGIIAQRKRLAVIVIGGVLLMLAVVLTLVFLPANDPQPKATWIWDTAQIEQRPEEIVDFAEREDVKVIFLQIGGGVGNDSYRRFISLAASHGIEVHALNGHPEWALREQRREGDDFLNWVAVYNRGVSPEERFKGVQFDVEPYLLKTWTKERESIVEQWMEGIRAWTETAKYNNLQIGAAVPFWLDEIDHPSKSVPLPLGNWMVDRFDYLAIMAYRDTAGRSYELARTTLSEADRQKKQVWVGVELGESTEGPGVSFHGQPLASLNREMKQLEKLGGRHASFAGVAVHSYESWNSKLRQPGK
ncbi:hypothetical protein LMZ02_25515 [Paenibacillus macerans]|nr:hypothetical protein [Paenibacillus macerans]UMV46796.1 hypothetical protein LMZ02_25515 [Paenibacillus macerans]